MLKVLAIDDKQDNLVVISALLKNTIPECQVVCAQSGPEGLKKAVEELPDTILLDIKMPEMDGFETCRNLQINEKTKNIPIIILTAVNTDSQSLAKGLELGAISFMHKPINEEELAAHVKTALRLKKAEDLLRAEKSFLEDKVEEQMAELRKINIRYQELFDNIYCGVAVFEISQNGKQIILRDINKTTVRIDKLERKKLIGRSIIKAFPLARETGLIDAMLRVWHIGIPEHCPVSFYHDNTLIGWRENYIYKLPSGEIVLVYEDITERMLAEKKLEASEEKFRLLSEQSLLGIVIFQDRKIRYTNEALAGILGFSVEEILGWGKDEYIKAVHPDDRAMFLERLQGKEELSQFQCRLVSKIELSKWIEIYLCSIVYEGKAARMATWIDITEKKESERKAKEQQQQLIQTDKLASLGILVAGVAHEINNPNHTIFSNSTLIAEGWKSITPILEEYYEENGDFLVGGLRYEEMRELMPRYLEGITNGARRIDNIVSDLKNFSRNDVYEINMKVDINRVVKSAVTLSSNLISKATQSFSVSYADDLPRIDGSYQRLEQVIINLLQNACQALSNRQESIYVSTFYERQNKSIAIVVCDEGAGISAEDLRKVKDPFYTTRRESGGTGLGLSISSAIIRDYGGTLELTSEPGKGTTVTVTLPAE